MEHARDTSVATVSGGVGLPRRPNRLSSVTNAVRILKAFTPADPSWGVTDLARRVGVSKSSTHRILSTLADEGVLEQDITTGRYQLGLAVFDMMAAMPSQRTLHKAVLVPMTELRSRTGETVQVGVLDQREVVYVERLDSPNTLTMFTELGRRTHAHATSSGKLLLAHLHRARLDRLLRGWRLPRVTKFTITDHDELRRDLESIRRRGYAENRQESEIGVVSIAAPVRDAAGRVVASLSLAGPAERVDPRVLQYIEAVMTFARAVSTQMGWSGRPEHR